MFPAKGACRGGKARKAPLHAHERPPVSPRTGGLCLARQEIVHVFPRIMLRAAVAVSVVASVPIAAYALMVVGSRRAVHYYYG